MIFSALIANGMNSNENNKMLSGKPYISISENKIDLIYPKELRYSFVKYEDKWRINAQSLWNEKSGSWEKTYTSFAGEFLYLGKTPFNIKSDSKFIYADNYKEINQDSKTGIMFYGHEYINDIRFEWTAKYYFDNKDNLPYLHSEITHKSFGFAELGFSPKVITRTIAQSDRQEGSMAHIISYKQSEEPILIERGYPLIWLNTKVGDNTYNCLLINDVNQFSSAGRYFISNRSDKSPYYTYWLIGSMKRDDSEFGKYYWNYRSHSTGVYPDETLFYPYTDYKINFLSLYRTGLSSLEFYRKYWAEAFNTVAPLDKIDFAATNWDEYARNQINEFKDNDENAGDRYVPGKGYYSAPVKDKMSHGIGNVCWHGSVGIIHGMLYYTWATDDKENYDFYRRRLTDINLPEWAENSAYNKGWINEFWIKDIGYLTWSSMWGTLDFGAYNLYNCYKLTGDKTYWNLFKNLIDYVKTTQIKNRKSFGEHWNDKDEQWYYLTPESSYVQAAAIPKDQDPGEYPGAMSVYTYLSLLVYDETKDESYKNDALTYIDFINSYLSHPQDFWTLCRVPKSNGLAFASLSNIKIYELTKNPKYLDYAEEWMYLLLTMYHLRSEGGNEIGFAHAGGLGVFDYVCVSSLETIESLYLAANLLKYRANPALLRYIALADRRHLLAYPAAHPDKKFIYKYIPMELVPQRDSFAMYMAGPIMIENVMLHAIHSTDDPAVTAICLNAAETGMDIKQSRNMILYNSSTLKKEFNLFVKGLDSGIYSVKIDKHKAYQMHSDMLKKNGVKLSLKGQQAVRVKIDKE